MMNSFKPQLFGGANVVTECTIYFMYNYVLVNFVRCDQGRYLPEKRGFDSHQMRLEFCCFFFTEKYLVSRVGSVKMRGAEGVYFRLGGFW